jgi:hypothetical protein
MVGEETGSEGSTSVMAVEEGRGARILNKESFLFKKEKKENLYEERALLLWFRGIEEGGVAITIWYRVLWPSVASYGQASIFTMPFLGCLYAH